MNKNYRQCPHCGELADDSWQSWQCMNSFNPNGGCDGVLQPMTNEEYKEYMTMHLPPENDRLKLDKYTFYVPSNDYRVHILRYDEPWVIIEEGCNAVAALIAHCKAARKVVSAVKSVPKQLRDETDVMDMQEILLAALRVHLAEVGE